MIGSRSQESDVLVVAGEASGDRIAAKASVELLARGFRVWGLAGPACAAAGVEVLADITGFGAMGLSDVASRAPSIASAVAAIARRVRIGRSPPSAALLVNFTELNTYLGRFLRQRGVRVLWCVAPQAWAWREGRFRTLGRSLDRLAVILPFEEDLWRRAGVEAKYVGHPALDAPTLPRAEARALLRLRPDPSAIALAILPGSRAGEVSRLARPFCEAASILLRERSITDARVLSAPWLDARARAFVEREAAAAGIPLVEPSTADGAAPLLSAFDLSLCASGTATLEAALAGAPPVVAYRMDPLTFAVARRAVKTPHIALPNILLGRRAFPELVQDEATPLQIAAAARALIAARADAPRLAAELRAVLLRPLESARAPSGTPSGTPSVTPSVAPSVTPSVAPSVKSGPSAPSAHRGESAIDDEHSRARRSTTFGGRIADLLTGSSGLDP